MISAPRPLVLALGVALVALVSAADADAQRRKTRAAAVSPACADLYAHANAAWLKAHQAPADAGAITALGQLAPDQIKVMALIRDGRQDISLSCGNAIASALIESYNEALASDGENFNADGEDISINRQCPECEHFTLKPEGNCVTCTYCGWSKCE